MFFYSFLAALVCAVSAQTNLLTNGDFEQPIGSEWETARCQGAVYTDDKISGNRSLLVTDMTESYGAIRQPINSVIEANKTYYASGWVKLHRSVEETNHFSLFIKFKYTQLGGGYKYPSLLIDTAVYRDEVNGWMKLHGEFTVPYYPQLVWSKLYAHPVKTDQYPEYLIDNFELYELPEDPNWRNKTVIAIQNERKTKLKLQLKVSNKNKAHYAGMRMTLSQKQLTGFGIGTNADTFQLATNEKYKKIVEDNFEWITLSDDLAWRNTEYSQHQLTWEVPDEGMNDLQKLQKRVRGGSIHETNYHKQPGFVRSMYGSDDIYRSAMKRVDDLLQKYRYRAEHWNVVNGMTADSDFLAARYGSDNIHLELYKRAQAVDFAAKLFVNEDGLINVGTNIADVTRLVKRMKAQGAPVAGIGARAEFSEYPSATQMINRLNLLAEVGLPIWLTNYTFIHPDPVVRANALNDVIDVALSIPSVEGIMLGSFWDLDTDVGNSSLWEGKSVTMNEAGQVLEDKITELYKFVDVRNISVTSGEIRDFETLSVYPGIYELALEWFNNGKWKRIRTNTINAMKEEEGDDGIILYTSYI